MTTPEKKKWRLLPALLVALLIVTAANALMDFGAILHDLTHSH